MAPIWSIYINWCCWLPSFKQGYSLSLNRESTDQCDGRQQENLPTNKMAMSKNLANVFHFGIKIIHLGRHRL